MANNTVIIAASSLSLLLIIGITSMAIVKYNQDDSRSASAQPSTTAQAAVHSTTKAIEEMCSTTSYQVTCTSSLSKALEKSNTSHPEPKDIVKASISVISDQVARVLNKSRLINSKDPKIQGALADCRELFGYAKNELVITMKLMHIQGLEDIPKKSKDFNNWISAVLSYQQTCVDGFPEGPTKQKMEKIVEMTKQMSSNALAILSGVVSVLSVLDLDGFNLRRRSRRLMMDGEELPGWVTETDRRHLLTMMKSQLVPNITVAQDGTGNFTTILDAITSIPKHHEGRVVVYIKKGIYKESVLVRKENITIYGDGSTETIITGSKNFIDGVRTFQTATFVAIGQGFVAFDIGFHNTAGAIKHQAVALRVQSDRAIFLKCRMYGYQDTLYAQTHRQFYRGCVITGTIDFIFGDATAVFQNCILRVLKPLDNQKNIVTAHARIDRGEDTGFVIQNCRIVPEKSLGEEAVKRSFLGRPWREYARTIVMESFIDGFISPEGYMPWDGDFALSTLVYGEYRNKGVGAKLGERVTWPGFNVLTRVEADEYTVKNFIEGQEWVGKIGAPVPIRLGFYTD